MGGMDHWMTDEERKQFEAATLCVNVWHIGQYRKHSGLPYIVHIYDVLGELSAWGVRCFRTWMGALGHDVGEDVVLAGRIPRHEVEAVMGDSMPIIDDLTFDWKNAALHGLSKPKYLRGWLPGETQKRVESLVIKDADRLRNVRDFMRVDLSYARKYMGFADPVFAAVDQRKDEIIARYSQFTFDCMKRRENALRVALDGGRIDIASDII